MIEAILLMYCQTVSYLVSLIGRSISYLLPVLAVIVFYEVFARYILDAPTLWAYDTSLFLFGYISALGGAYAQQREGHINVDIIHAKVSEKTRRIFDVLTSLLAIGFLLVLAKTCAGMLLESFDFHYKTQSEWAPPMHHFWLMMTVSSVIFIAQYSTELIANLFFLLKGRELNGEIHKHILLSELPFKVDNEQLNSAFDKESKNGH